MEQINLPWFIPVTFVVGIITYEYFVFSFYFLPAFYSVNPSGMIIVTIIFNSFVFMLTWSYYKAIKYPPGFVPSDINEYYLNNLEQIKGKAKTEVLVQQELRKREKEKRYGSPSTSPLNSNANQHNMDIELGGGNANPAGATSTASNGSVPNSINQDIQNFDVIQSMTEISFCFKCKKVQVPRSHHCKQCKQCVIRMDHHCPWVGNCVGVKNHQYFIQFLCYATISTFYVFAGIAIDYLFCNKQIFKELSSNEQFHAGLSSSTSLALSLCIGFLFQFQVGCLLQNITTVESHIQEMEKRNPFDQGTKYANFCEIMGDNFQQWTLPIQNVKKYKGDTLEYTNFQSPN